MRCTGDRCLARDFSVAVVLCPMRGPGMPGPYDDPAKSCRGRARPARRGDTLPLLGWCSR